MSSWHLLIPFTFLSLKAFSQEIEIIQPLNFGIIVVGNNNNTSTVDISPTGNIRTSNKIWLIERGHHAELLLSGFPIYTQLNIQAQIIDAEIQSSHNANEQFKLSSITTAPFVTTDSAGQAKVYLGGRLETSGNGHFYLNSDYTTQIKIEVDY